ncbi:MAG: TetR/AcrR family transcriptional regulator [Chloroflexota bacterium]
MPRESDPTLYGRILDAAQQLWAVGGEDALTMRAVAARAGTTTPTVYARFADKQELLTALRSRAVERLDLALEPAGRDLLQGCRTYLEFAGRQPYEYALLFGDGWPARTSAQDGLRPLDRLQTSLVQELGGNLEQRLPPALTIWSMLHGAASIIMAWGREHEFARQMQAACLNGCEALVRAARTTPQSGSVPQSRGRRRGR